MDGADVVSDSRTFLMAMKPSTVLLRCVLILVLAIDVPLLILHSMVRKRSPLSSDEALLLAYVPAALLAIWIFLRLRRINGSSRLFSMTIGALFCLLVVRGAGLAWLLSLPLHYSRLKATDQNLRIIQAAIHDYFEKTSTFPSQLADLDLPEGRLQD